MHGREQELKAMDLLDHGIRRIRNLSVTGVLAFEAGDGHVAGIFAAIGEYLDQVEQAQTILRDIRRPEREARQALLLGPKAGAVMARQRRRAVKRA